MVIKVFFNSKKQAALSSSAASGEALPRIICPFCGKPSESRDHCISCGSKFNKEVLKIAMTEETDNRSDRIGPFSTKTAKILSWVVIAVCIVLFVVATEWSGAGVTGH